MIGTGQTLAQWHPNMIYGWRMRSFDVSVSKYPVLFLLLIWRPGRNHPG